MHPEIKQECLKRLRFVSGHLGGVRRMVESDEYCVNVLRQTHAIRRAIEKIEVIMLDGHLRGCVVEGVREGRQDQVIDELLDLYQVSNK